MNTPTIVPTMTDFAYAAGIVDGEGNVSIRKKSAREGRRVRDIHTEVIITITDRPVLEWLQARWGGGILHQHRSEKHAHWQDIYRWNIYSARAGKFLRDIQPYCIVKKPQVDLGIAFQALLEQWGRNRYHSGQKAFRQLPNDILEMREHYFRRMKVLNLMGHSFNERESHKKVMEQELKLSKSLATGLSTTGGSGVGSFPVIRDDFTS